MPNYGGEGSNQTPIKIFFAIKTENLREGGSNLKYQFSISKQFKFLNYGCFNSALFKGVRVIICLNFTFIKGGCKQFLLDFGFKSLKWEGKDFQNGSSIIVLKKQRWNQ